MSASWLSRYVDRQREWSARTFGDGRRTLGIANHIRKELLEIEAEPTDLEEWIDVIILAMDGFWRAGGLPDNLARELYRKQSKNFERQWPAHQPEDAAVEHVR